MITVVAVLPPLRRKGNNPPYIVDVPDWAADAEGPVVTKRISFERPLNDAQY
jgi:hypothetical protein